MVFDLKSLIMEYVDNGDLHQKIKNNIL